MAVRGCALCEAGAGLAIECFTGLNDQTIRQLTDGFSVWLTSHGSDAPTPQMEHFIPVQPIRNRHKCVLLACHATLKALTAKWSYNRGTLGTLFRAYRYLVKNPQNRKQCNWKSDNEQNADVCTHDLSPIYAVLVSIIRPHFLTWLQRFLVFVQVESGYLTTVKLSLPSHRKNVIKNLHILHHHNTALHLYNNAHIDHGHAPKWSVLGAHMLDIEARECLDHLYLRLCLILGF